MCPTTINPFILLLLISICASAQHIKIAFPKFSTPRGWISYNPANLSRPTVFGFIPDQAPDEFRSHVKSPQGFTYKTRVPPGKYIARLGFLENQPCKIGGRVFHFLVNRVHSGLIDLFKDAHPCITPYTKNVGPFDAADGLVVIEAIPDHGWAPILSNIQLFKVGTTKDLTNSKKPIAVPVPDPPPPSEIKVSFSKNQIPDGWTFFDPDRLSGDVIFVEGSPEIQDTLFRNQIKARGGFTYNQDLQPGVYDLELWFMELNRNGCILGKRVFKAEVNGNEIDDIDVFARAGCRSKHRILFSNVVVEDDGLEIALKPIKGFAPFLAFFVVRSADESSNPDPSPSPESYLNDNPAVQASTPSQMTPQGQMKTNIEMDIGARSDEDAPAGSTPHYFPGTITVDDNSTVPLFYYRTSRYGKDFSYSFDLPAGAYDVTLGFVENYSPHCQNEPGKRVFNVYVNDAIKIESFDIYEEAGCHHGVEYVIEQQTVATVNTKLLTIRFQAVTNNAVVSFIRIETATKECIPVSTTGEILADHAAHAVPGTYPPLDGSKSASSYVDSDGDGYHWVQLDASGSHTHFFDSKNNIIGKITSYTWTIAETGQVISRSVSFAKRFPLGTTRLKLAVVDNSCTTDEAETTVTVTGKIQTGQYCYYYSGLKAPPMGGSLSSAPRPSFAHVADSLALGFPSFDFDGEDFALRCQFFLEHDVESKVTTISIDTGGSGIAKVYKGEDLILDMETSTSMTSVKTALAAGLTFFEVVYYRSGPLVMAPQLRFLLDGFVPSTSLISYDRTTIVPVLREAAPSKGQLSGGTKVKLQGYGLFGPFTVSFGEAEAQVLSTDASSGQVFVITPGFAKSQVVNITITTPAGLKSNAISYAYGTTTCDAISFEEREVVHVVREGKEEKRTPIDLNLPTCSVLSGDGLLYVGTLGGTVRVLGYNHETLIANSHCYSEVIHDPQLKKPDGSLSTRDILGITFDPRDNPPRPYVSTNTLYWLGGKTIDPKNPVAWRNGAVDRLIHSGTTAHPMDSPGLCLLYDRRIVSGLPVSNHDHGVNGLLFTQSGDLLINVGGLTNSGLPGYKLGGLWETYLSAAIVVARLSKPGFDGEIEYTYPNNSRLARVKKGDVALFATGLRNAFPLTMRRSGEIWTTDQGPNCKFGDTASSCDEYDEEKASKWDPHAKVDYQGKVRHGWKECPFGPGREDKVLAVVEGSYYGHPNLIRGEGECTWIDPYTDLSATGEPPSKKYRKAFAEVKSSATGIGEYGAEHFCGALKGDLIVSRYKWGSTSRIRKDDDGDVEVESLYSSGGTSFSEASNGDIVFPLLSEKKVKVIRPVVSQKTGTGLVGVHPWRHGAKGGTAMMVSGWGFGEIVKVTVGGESCEILRKAEKEIVCVVPAGKGGASVAVSVETYKGDLAEIKNAVMYMNDVTLAQ